ncbi:MULTISPECIES: S1C family serine protease [unclassified Streptomyces]|uniref:S1C family serine protease n=1 Tax=unclassified Streptomyces TaxID=2593676 RepID=UPI00202E7EE0|nr:MULTISPECIES: trypsin-like peptidase domain-containing protein [unclassified Streptomyces]MCM1971056.1 trypsin-like peptidase domain-containing protein [Streptomyces sp. G1]MCX5124231.1 trypsin-like peptidase domain-containing protein [Streptomyces sp. NBC_00347]
MTENLRREGEYPQENRPQQPAPWGEDWQRGRDRLAQDAAYPPPPAYPPAAPAPGWHEAHQPPVIQGETVPQNTGGGSGSGNGGWATWGDAPAAPAPQGPGHARAKRPVALLAAVALAAAVVGGGTAAAVQQMLNKTNGTGTGVNGSTISQSSNGTVSGVAENVSPSVVRIDTSTASGQGTGSGIVITADGEIVTNNHVIDGAAKIQVTMSDGKKYSAKIVGTDPDKDLALIKLEGASGLKPAGLGNSDNIKVGDEVVAIGSPDRLTGTVTSGIVSALNREVNVPKSEKQQSPQDGFPFSYGGKQFNGNTGTDTTSYKAIQTDASLNPGNSGGALVNMNGEIVGMPSAIYSPSSGSGSAGSVGLGFAIPVNTIKADLPSLRKGGPGGAGSNGNGTDSGTGNTANGFGTSF